MSEAAEERLLLGAVVALFATEYERGRTVENEPMGSSTDGKVVAGVGM